MVVVKVDEYGTTVLTSSSGESLTIETENFINNFIHLFYNYSSENFDDHIDRSFAYLDTGIATKLADNLTKMSEKMKTQNITQQAFAHKIVKIKDDYFEVELTVKRMNGFDESGDTYKVYFELDRTNRTLENPYGLIISKLEEVYE
ncbi:MAG: hypothetical protein IT245_01275 [Bacteroidia bacterium]|nr:hypothetical protein [Bacteroidia bacterium]